MISFSSEVNVLFGLFKRKHKGNIEREFSWLSLKKMARDFDTGELSAQKVGTTLCRMSIYGGIDLKRTLDAKKLLQGANPDKVVVEGVGFVWSNVYRACLKSTDFDIYDDEELAGSIYTCGAALHEVLSKYTDFELPNNFTAAYSSMDILDSTVALNERLLRLADIEVLGDIKDNVGTTLATRIFSTTMVPGIVEASSNVIRFYLENRHV